VFPISIALSDAGGEDFAPKRLSLVADVSRGGAMTLKISPLLSRGGMI